MRQRNPKFRQRHERDIERSIFNHEFTDRYIVDGKPIVGMITSNTIGTTSITQGKELMNLKLADTGTVFFCKFDDLDNSYMHASELTIDVVTYRVAQINRMGPVISFNLTNVISKGGTKKHDFFLS